MPSTPTKLTLFLCWSINATKHATIKMCEADGEPDHFPKFFAALKVAVDSIDEIKGLGGFRIEPSKGVPMKDYLKFANVYKCSDVVYKLFETKRCPVPNVKMVKDVLGSDYLSEMKWKDLTLDKEFKLLTYKYIPDGSKRHLTLMISSLSHKPLIEFMVLNKLYKLNRYINKTVFKYCITN